MTMEEGPIKVVTPIDDTSAAKAGIMAITHLDEEPVQGLTLNQVVEKMRGPVSTTIKLKRISAPHAKHRIALLTSNDSWSPA